MGAPGRYKVFALKGTPPFAHQSHEFMKPYEQYGVAVDVSLSNPAPNITVPLVPELPGR